MSQTVLDQVVEVAADVFSLPRARLGAGSSPETIDSWDSVQHLNLVLALESRFGISLAPEDIERMKTLGAVSEVVGSKIGAGA